MGVRLYKIQASQVNFKDYTQEQVEEIRAFMAEDIYRRCTGETIGYYDEYILDRDIDEFPPLVREFLTTQIRENGGSINLQIG